MVTELATQELAGARAARIRAGIQQGALDLSQVVEALNTIRDNRLYRATHDTFEDYCADRFGDFDSKARDLVRYAVACRPSPGRRRVDQRSVYFIQAVAGGLIKIGVAGHVTGRFGDIQRMCPIPLTILATVPAAGQALETELHQRFAFARRHGEWFEPVPELLAYIAENGVRP